MKEVIAENGDEGEVEEAKEEVEVGGEEERRKPG